MSHARKTSFLRKLLFTFFGLISMAKAATYTSSNVPLAISESGTPTINSTIVIAEEDATVNSVTVTLDITHTYTGDLDIYLIHPDGTEVELSTDNGGSFPNYTNTTFDESSGTSITTGSAPFSGTFDPEGELEDLNGKAINGTWTLRIFDDTSADGGTLNSWNLSINTPTPPITFDYPDANTVLALDFTSDGSGNASGLGGSNPPIGTETGYVAFPVAELGPANNTSNNPSLTVNAITFGLTGNVSAWPGTGGASLLTGDYLFLPASDGTLGANNTLQWNVSGLVANTEYTLEFTPGTSTSRTVTINSGSESVIITGATGAQQLTLSSDSQGTISGSFTGSNGEGNLAAISITGSQVAPPPSSISYDYPDDDTVLALDFTSDVNGSTRAGSTEGYIDFIVAELGGAGNTTTDPSINVNDILFAITGDTSSWPGDNSSVNSLNGDYLFFPGTDGTLNTDKTVQWSVTGLTPNRYHAFYFTSGPNANNRSFTVDVGNESLEVIGGTGSQHMVLLSNNSGAVSGSFTGNGNEGNLAALRISTDIPVDDSVQLPPSYVWQIDFQGDAGGAFGSANPITATEDLGYGSTWNAFQVEATNDQAFVEPPTNHNAVENPELLNLKDSNDNETGVHMKFVADPNNPSQSSFTSAYNVGGILGLGGADHAYGDHWFYGGQGRDTPSLFFQFENLPAGTYALTTVVNPSSHNPDRDIYVRIGSQYLEIAPTHNNGGYADSNFIGTISNITVGADGILAGEFGTPINDPGETEGNLDPSLSAATLRLVVGNDIGELNYGEKFRIPVLANDSSTGDVTAITIVDAPAFGVATVQSDNTILYTHTTGTPSSDTITYTYTDDNGVSQIGTVTLNFSSGTRITANTINLPATAPEGSLAIVDAFPEGNTFTFTEPTDMASIPGNTQRFFVVEKDGIVWEFPDIGSSTPTRSVFMDFTDQAWKTAQGGELDQWIEFGVKSLTFHPDFQNGSPYVFVTYNFQAGAPLNTNDAAGNGTSRLSRFTVSNNGAGTVDMLSEVVFIELDNLDRDHNIDAALFGPDGYLYVGTGDDRRPNDHAQTITNALWCSIIRIDVDRKAENLEPNPASFVPTDGTGKAYYKVPADNPYAATSGTVNYNGVDYAYDAVRSEIYVTGTRNPWRFSFDTIDGETVIWHGDIGEAGDSKEEINILRKGDNAGWKIREGGDRTMTFTDGDGNTITGATGNIYSTPPAGVTLRDPEFFYPRNNGGIYGGSSVIGGYVNRSANYPTLLGKYIFADFMTSHIWALERTETVGEPIVERIGGLGGIVDFIPDPATGDILMLSWNSESGALLTGEDQIGKVFRLRQNAAPDIGLPNTLSETGIFADLNDLSPNPGVHPYDPMVTFWSDNAIKTRWFALPDSTSTITYDQDNQWKFPTGSTFVKHFDMELRRGDPSSKKRLETRVLYKTEDGVYGISYQWNEAGTEATIAPDQGASIALSIDHDNNPTTASINQTWQIPSRSQCLSCHNSDADYMLGINTRQMNETSLPLLGNYGNYLDLMNNAGFFDSSIGSATSLPAHAKIGDATASLENKVRTYLDVNCAYCHREQGGFNLRANLARTSMNIIDQNDTGQITVDNPDLKRIRSGHPDDSSILQRILATPGYNRMPPIGSAITDDAGAELLITWIKQLGGNDTNEDWVRLTITGPGGSHPHGNGNYDVSFAGDTDGDGLNNAAEVLLGTDLRNQQHNDYISTMTVQDGGMEYREIEIELSDDLADTLTWHLDKSTDLTTWNPLNVNPTTVGVTDNKRTVRFRDPAPIDDLTPNRFYRIRVEANE